MQPFHQIAGDQQQLLDDSQRLLAHFEKNPPEFRDFSFIVFPAAKAYEGFLKDYLLQLGLISREQHGSRRFRIGRALNPDVHPNQRDEWWLFDDLGQKCGGAVARQLWNTWLACRNHLFHYFPNEAHFLSLAGAKDSLAMITESITTAQSCLLAEKAK